MSFSDLLCETTQAAQTECDVLPLPEISVEDPAGESLSANPDTFQHTVTTQLVKDKMVIHGT